MSHVFLVGGGSLHELRLGLGDAGARRRELRLQIGMLDRGDDLTAPGPGALLERERLQPAANLDADIAAAARHHVAGGDEHRQDRGRP